MEDQINNTMNEAPQTVPLNANENRVLMTMAEALRKGIFGAMTEMEESHQFYPLFVITQIIGELVGIFYTEVLPQMLNDLSANMDKHSGKYAIMTEEARRGLLEAMIKERNKTIIGGDQPGLILPSHLRRRQ